MYLFYIVTYISLLVNRVFEKFSDYVVFEDKNPAKNCGVSIRLLSGLVLLMR